MLQKYKHVYWINYFSTMNSARYLIYTLFFGTLLISPSLSSAQKTFFYDRNWNQIFKTKDKKDAKFYRKVENEEGRYRQSDFYVDKKRTPAAVKYFQDINLSLPIGKHIAYYRSGRIKFVGNYVQGLKKGLWQYFWPNGKIREEGVFVENQKDGIWKRFHKNGDLWAEESYSNGLPHGTHSEYWNNDQVKVTANYSEGQLDGDFISYYANGSLRRKEVYAQGEPVEKACFSKSGQDTTYYPYFFTPLFPGCEQIENKPFIAIQRCSNQKMYSFIQENLNYPDAARIYGKQGTVLLSFVVKEDGSLKDPLFLEDISEEIAHECMKLFRRFPDWIPGKKDGVVSDVYFEIPLVFQLN